MNLHQLKISQLGELYLHMAWMSAQNIIVEYESLAAFLHMSNLWAIPSGPYPVGTTCQTYINQAAKLICGGTSI